MVVPVYSAAVSSGIQEVKFHDGQRRQQRAVQRPSGLSAVPFLAYEPKRIDAGDTFVRLRKLLVDTGVAIVGPDPTGAVLNSMGNIVLRRATIQRPSWLQIAESDHDDLSRASLKLLNRSLDSELCAARFRQLDQWLDAADPGKMSIIAMISILRGSFVLRGHLLRWAAFRDRCMVEITARGEQAEDELLGLY
jgi:hypothetical protein